jgi:ribosome-associated toxin RatA of RatAB toxin-antitoxin module
MAPYAAERSVEVAATPQDCFAALTDFERLPQWQSRLKEVHVLERDAEGRGREVSYLLDATVKTVRYVLRHDYDEPWRIGSTYLEGDFKTFDGTWTFADKAGSARVTLQLQIDPGLKLPGLAVRLIHRTVLDRALSELRDHVEGD